MKNDGEGGLNCTYLPLHGSCKECADVLLCFLLCLWDLILWVHQSIMVGNVGLVLIAFIGLLKGTFLAIYIFLASLCFLLGHGVISIIWSLCCDDEFASFKLGCKVILIIVLVATVWSSTLLICLSIYWIINDICRLVSCLFL